MGPDAASNTATTSNMANQSSGPDDKFLFDCEHLIMFCSYFEKLDVHDQTDSMLEVKLSDLDNRWKRMQSSYETLMLAPESISPREIKEKAKVNFNVCSDAFYIARSNILDILRISRGGSRDSTGFIKAESSCHSWVSTLP